MSLAVAQAKLKDAYKDFRLRYLRVCEVWDDQARRDFEQQHLADIEPRLRRIIEAMSAMDAAIAAARNDTADEADR